MDVHPFGSWMSAFKNASFSRASDIPWAFLKTSSLSWMDLALSQGADLWAPLHKDWVNSNTHWITEVLERLEATDGNIELLGLGSAGVPKRHPFPKAVPIEIDSGYAREPAVDQ